MGFIFGHSKKINSLEELTLGMEKERMKMMSRVFLPMLARFNQFMQGKMPLLGNGSLIEKFGDMFAAIGMKVSDMGQAVFKWFIETDVLGRLTSSIKGLNVESLGGAVTEFGDSFIDMIVKLTSNGGINRLIEQISNFIGIVKKIF